jgi:hypothetical protein
MLSLSVVFALVAFILTLIEMARGSMKSLIYWAVLFLCLALLSPVFLIR